MVATKKWILVFTLIFTGLAGKVCSQSVYVNTQQGIFKLNGAAGTCERIQIPNECGVDNSLLSIAVYKDTIYYSTWNGELKRFVPGVPGSCEILIDGGPSYNSLTVDQNGIVYMALEELAIYNPHTKELVNLGRMPFFSAGDMLFYKDKLLLAGYDTRDWATGIFEINVNDVRASKLFMPTQDFIGLMSFPTPCGNSRFFGLSSHNTGTTDLIELDLANKTVMGESCVMTADILDAGSTTETGMEYKVDFTSLLISKSCQLTTGTVNAKAVYPGSGLLTYTLDNAITNTTGIFENVREGQHKIKVVGGSCSTDTIFTVAAAYNLVNGIVKTSPDNCLNTAGSVQINAASANGAITFTLVNSGLTQSSGLFTNLRGGRYDFRISDESGCVKDTSVVIAESSSLGCNDILIPNAFTPNQDGKNDFFSMHVPSNCKDVFVQVFNRWGNLVYERKGNPIAWDGNYKSAPQPVGVYVYNVVYTDGNGNRKTLKGTVTLIR